MSAIWRSRGLVLSGLLVAGSVACELVVGIGDQPHLVATGDGGDAGDGAAPLVCSLPGADGGAGSGDAFVRLANVVPTLDGYDFCLTPTGGQPPANGVLGSGGGGCPPLLYRGVLAPFPVASGTYKVDAVAPGTGCGTPLATAASVNFDPATTTTVVLFGAGGGAQLQMKAFREEKSTITEPKVRFINAWSDGPSALDIGATVNDELPTNFLSSQIFGLNAGYTNVASSKVDANGYFTVLPGVTIPLGFAPTGTTSVAVARNMSSFGSLSTFAIGTSSDPRFPVDLMVCNQEQTDATGLYTQCSNKPPDDVIVDVYNVQLQGRFTPLRPERRPAIQDAISKFDGDFACITEAWEENDKQAIINAAKAHFPYAQTFTTTMTTQPTDPRDQQGNIPPPYTQAACAPNPQESQDFLTCLAQNCTTGAPGDMNGQFPENAVQCILSACILPGATLLGDPPCYSCIITQIESGATFANAQTACTTDPTARFAHNGNIGVVLLSTHPFLGGTTSPDAGTEILDAGDGGLPQDDSPGLFVLPSTEYRAAAIRAPVDLTPGQTGFHTKVDVYCVILTTPATSAQRPYTGQYGGNGATDPDKWLNEQTLQATQLTNWISAVSGARKRRAIIAGEFYAGPGIGGLTALNTPTYNTLTTALPLAMKPGYSPLCTFCSDNPLVAAGGSAGNQWSSYSLLSDLAVPETLDNQVIVKDPVVFAPDAGLDAAVPPSLYYGMRTVIRVRP